MSLLAGSVTVCLAANLPGFASVLSGVPLAIPLVVPAVTHAFAKIPTGSVSAAAFAPAIDLVLPAIANGAALFPSRFPAAFAKAPATLDRVANLGTDVLDVPAALLNQRVAVSGMGGGGHGGNQSHGHDHT